MPSLGTYHSWLKRANAMERPPADDDGPMVLGVETATLDARLVLGTLTVGKSIFGGLGEVAGAGATGRAGPEDCGWLPTEVPGAARGQPGAVDWGDCMAAGRTKTSAAA